MIKKIFRKLQFHAAGMLGAGRRHTAQLELALPPAVRDLPMPPVPNGYRLRAFIPDDEAPLTRLLQRAGFDFNREALRSALSICLPRGCFLAEHEATGTLAATMMARHLASATHPFGGRIDWLATDPDHRRRGLASICARSATRRLLEAGYDDVWVTTDDHRLDALKIFLSMGFRPVISNRDSEARWQLVFANLGVPASRD